MSTSIDAKLASLTTILNTKAPPLKDDRGVSYDPDVLAKLYSQIFPNFNASSSTGTALQESVSDSTNIGFNSKEAAKLFGRTPTASEMIVLDMARGLVSQDILDVNDLAKYKPTEVTELDYNVEAGPPNEVKVIKFIDPATGKEFKPDQLGSTYTGKGGTGYRVSLDAEGKPTFSTEGFSTSDREQITKALALTAAIAFGGPLLGEALGAAGAAGATGAGAGAAGALGTEAGLAGAGALGTETALTGTGLLGASEAAFVAADAAQLAAQGLSTSQITSTLAATGIPTTTASTLAQAATGAFAEAIASGVPANIAAMSAEVAAGNAAAGLSVTDAVAAGKAVGTGTVATGAANAAGNIIGGGGAITAGTTGALTGANALAGTVAGSTAASTAAGAGAGSTVGSTAASAAAGVAKALLGGDTSNLLGGLLSSGVNLSMIQDAADKLRAQGALSQKEYSTLAQNLQNKYRFVGQEAQTGLLGVADKTSSMVGNFTPYGVTNQLFGTTVNPQTGALETTVTPYGEKLYKPFADVAAQSAKAAEMTNVDQLAKDYYDKVAALSAPEIERQRLATEERLRAQGRLGVSGSAFGGSSPELLAQEQAIARQQLERELQSRQAALSERGTLIGQGTAAYSPISNLLGMQAQQQQLSGQLGQMAQQGRIAAAQLYAQPAVQAYTQPLQLYNAGLNQIGQTERMGIASNLASQQAALDALAVGRTNVANNLLGPGGVNVGNIVNAATELLNQPSNYVPGTDITYADALAQGIIVL